MTPADPVVSPADTREAIERAEEWIGEFRDTWDWPIDFSTAGVRTRSVDRAAAWTTLDEAATLAEEMTALAAALLAVGERDKAEIADLRERLDYILTSVPAEWDQDVLAWLSGGEELTDVGERDRRQIARLTEALAAYELAVQAALRAAPLHWQEYRDPFELRPEIGKARHLGRAAVLACEEDAGA